MSRPTQAIIDLQALRDNFALAQSLAADSQTMPMVKANAYGHGMVEVAQALAEIAPAYGVIFIVLYISLYCCKLDTLISCKYKLYSTS